MNRSAFPLSLLTQILLSTSLILGQESIEERLLEEQAESSEQSELLEIILGLRENPIDLNQAGLEELDLIPTLTPKLRRRILQYRAQNGPFTSKEELLRVPGLHAELFELISDLVYVPASRVRQPGTDVHVRTRVTDRIEKSRGFREGTYESSSQKIYNRIRFSSRDKIQGALLIEKDSGEHRLDDLRLFYLQAEPNSHLSLVVGNYHLETGQGLVLWGPYGFSKGGDAIFPIRKKARGIRGYTTVDENAALLGAAVRLRANRLDLVTFASRNKLDATPTSNSEVSGFFTSGFHRNSLEREKKDVVSESVVGARAQYRHARFSIGTTAYYASFDKSVNDPELVRNRFKFRGKSNHVLGLDWEWSWQEALFFGEVARSKNNGSALLAGTIWDFGAAQLAFLFRDYGRNFQNLHGFGFGNSNGTTQNERGYYTGLRYRIGAATTWRAFYDLFENPWRTFFEPLPTAGRDFSTEVEHKFGRQLRLTLRYRDRNGQEVHSFIDALGRSTQELLDFHRRQWRLQLEYRLSSALRLRNRLERVEFQQRRFQVSSNRTDEKGLALMQEIRFKPNRSWQILARMTFFDTASFDSRIFQYEHDLPGLATNRALFGRGTRWYALLKYTPRKFLILAAKYSETVRDDVDSIGTGPDEISSNLDRRFGLQLELVL